MIEKEKYESLVINNKTDSIDQVNPEFAYT